MRQIADSIITIIRSVSEQHTARPDYNSWFLLLIICITGLIGGLINYLTNSINEDHAAANESLRGRFSFKKNLSLQLLLGVAGAALIPLSLYLTSSKLFQEPEHSNYVYLIFSGYCFIGAIFSQAILNSLAKRLDLVKFQEDLKNQKERLDETEKKVETAKEFIIDKLEDDDAENSTTEEETIKTTRENIEKEFKDLGGANLGDNHYHPQAISHIHKILNEMKESKYTDRSVEGLSKQTKLDKDTVKILVKVLRKLGFVKEVNWYGKIRYRLTEKGRKNTLEIV